MTQFDCREEKEIRIGNGGICQLRIAFFLFIFLKKEKDFAKEKKKLRRRRRRRRRKKEKCNELHITVAYISSVLRAWLHTAPHTQSSCLNGRERAAGVYDALTHTKYFFFSPLAKRTQLAVYIFSLSARQTSSFLSLSFLSYSSSCL